VPPQPLSTPDDPSATRPDSYETFLFKDLERGTRCLPADAVLAR